jgi:hypothetical protein
VENEAIKQLSSAQKLSYAADRYYAIIFSHDFAKAFWGEEIARFRRTGTTMKKEIPEWKYHLQQMVLEENPLQSLAQFLDIN